jgi:hypothetical protein
MVTAPEYLPPLPPSPQEVRRWNRRRWRRTDTLRCLAAWLLLTALFVHLINVFDLPLPGL